MRTTLDIDTPVLEAARALAASSQRSLGAVISELALRGLRGESRGLSEKTRFPTFQIPVDASPLDPARIRECIETDGLPD